MRTVIEMAHEAGMLVATSRDSLAQLEHFAELIRADEREKYKWYVHSCGPTCTRYACVAMREAVQAEREACASECDEWIKNGSSLAEDIAAAIRARSNT